jgi:hypothetical protein
MAKLNHTTIPGVRAAAKKGLKLISDGKVKDNEVSDLAAAGAKKIASGQKLSDEHVRQMATYHDGHAGQCPPNKEDATSAEDLMWGGPAGAMWAGSRCAAMDTTTLADDTVDLDALFAGDEPLSFEIYGRVPAGEETHLDDDDSGLLWAPILRSGTLAMRPVNGVKVRDPLVFVAGHSEDQRKEIGLEDLLDAFNADAIQHVTLPTTHENNVLDNTGFIEAMKIADSTMRIGEKVLMGAHRFTEPEVLGRVQRGSIANRSSGILYDFTNTETGQTFPAVIEHVCLTNRPFFPGMEPYGQLEDLDFSDRTVVPLMLSEAPAKEKDKESGSSSSSVSDSQWDGSASRFTDAQYKSSCIVNRGGKGSVKEECSLPVREPDGTLNRAAVHSAAGRIGSLTKVTPDQKKTAARKLISLYRGQLKEIPPPNLMKMVAVSTNMSEEDLRKELQLADIAWQSDGVSLNNIRSQLVDCFSEMRQGPNDEPSSVHFYVMDVTPNQALVECEYGYGEDGDTWVVPFDVNEGDLSLSDYSNWIPVTKEWVTDDDAQTQKQEIEGLLQRKPSASSTGTVTGFSEASDPLTQASNERIASSRQPNTSPNIGGRSMSLTREQIGQLDLSDQDRNVLLQDLEERERDRAELNKLRIDRKKVEVSTYLGEIKEPFKSQPGFLKEVERCLLEDDGKVAAVLNLSDVGGATQQNQTITEVVKRLVGALTLSDTASGQAQQAAANGLPNLLESPIGGRPPEAPETPGTEDGKPLTGEELLAQWEKDLGPNDRLNLDLAPASGTSAAQQSQPASTPAA